MADILDFSAIPVSKRIMAKENILAYIPNNQMIDDPNWVDPGDGSIPDQIPEFTDLEWLNEKVWDFLVTCNQRGHNIRINQAAEAVVDIRNE